MIWCVYESLFISFEISVRFRRVVRDYVRHSIDGFAVYSFMNLLYVNSHICQVVIS